MMMNHVSRGVITLMVMSLMGWASEPASVSPLNESTTASEEQGDAHQIRLGSTLVNTFAIVTKKNGTLVSNLGAADFIVEDNGVRQKITEFSRETQLPLSLALIIDRSESVQSRFELERSAAVHFLKSVLRPGKDQGGLVAFDSDVYLVHDFTDDVTSLTSKIKNLSVSGNSGIFDAVYKTVRGKFGPIGEGRKVVILITDGDDTASQVTLQQAIDMAWRTDVIVYAIGIRGTKAGATALKELARATGGRALFLSEDTHLAELFAQVEDELRNQYSIGFQLNRAPDGRFHKLRIRTRKRGLRVRARLGYYAISSQRLSPPSGMY